MKHSYFDSYPLDILNEKIWNKVRFLFKIKKSHWILRNITLNYSQIKTVLPNLFKNLSSLRVRSSLVFQRFDLCKNMLQLHWSQTTNGKNNYRQPLLISSCISFEEPKCTSKPVLFWSWDNLLISVFHSVNKFFFWNYCTFYLAWIGKSLE